MVEEIDLSPEEEADLDRAWEKLRRRWSAGAGGDIPGEPDPLDAAEGEQASSLQAAHDELVRRQGDANFAAPWEESRHPRGQPENKGEFGPGGGGAAATQAPASPAPRPRTLKEVRAAAAKQRWEADPGQESARRLDEYLGGKGHGSTLAFGDMPAKERAEYSKALARNPAGMVGVLGQFSPWEDNGFNDKVEERALQGVLREALLQVRPKKPAPLTAVNVQKAWLVDLAEATGAERDRALIALKLADPSDALTGKNVRMVFPPEGVADEDFEAFLKNAPGCRDALAIGGDTDALTPLWDLTVAPTQVAVTDVPEAAKGVQSETAEIQAEEFKVENVDRYKRLSRDLYLHATAGWGEMQLVPRSELPTVIGLPKPFAREAEFAAGLPDGFPVDTFLHPALALAADGTLKVGNAEFAGQPGALESLEAYARYGIPLPLAGDTAEFAARVRIRLPQPYEEGKHPRGYHGRWRDANAAHQQAEEVLKAHEKALGKSAEKIDALQERHEEAKAAYDAAKKVARAASPTPAGHETHKAQIAAIIAKGQLATAKAAHAALRKVHTAAKKEHTATKRELNAATKEKAKAEKKTKPAARAKPKAKAATKEKPEPKAKPEAKARPEVKATAKAKPAAPAGKPKPPRPGFTGKDPTGHCWQSGRMVPCPDTAEGTLATLKEADGDLSDAYREASKAEPGLGIGAFHDRLRALEAQGTVKPVYSEQPLKALENPETALWDDQKRKIVVGYEPTGKKTAGPLPEPADPAAVVGAVRQAVVAHAASNVPGDLRIGDLHRQVDRVVSNVRTGQLQDAIRQLYKSGDVGLVIWGGLPMDIPPDLEPFCVGHKLMGYVRGTSQLQAATNAGKPAPVPAPASRSGASTQAVTPEDLLAAVQTKAERGKNVRGLETLGGREVTYPVGGRAPMLVYDPRREGQDLPDEPQLLHEATTAIESSRAAHGGVGKIADVYDTLKAVHPDLTLEGFHRQLIAWQRNDLVQLGSINDPDLEKPEVVVKGLELRDPRDRYSSRPYGYIQMGPKAQQRLAVATPTTEGEPLPVPPGDEERYRAKGADKVTAEQVRQVLDTWQELENRTGKHNLVELHHLIPALAGTMTKAQAHAAIQRLRLDGILTANGAEGRFGVTPQEQEYGLYEPGSHAVPRLLNSVSRRVDPEEMRDYLAQLRARPRSPRP